MLDIVYFRLCAGRGDGADGQGGGDGVHRGGGGNHHRTLQLTDQRSYSGFLSPCSGSGLLTLDPYK